MTEFYSNYTLTNLFLKMLCYIVGVNEKDFFFLLYLLYCS